MSLLGSRREKLAASLAVLGVAVGLYANTLTGEFVFDDHAAIEVNADVRCTCLLRRKQCSELGDMSGRRVPMLSCNTGLHPVIPAGVELLSPCLWSAAGPTHLCGWSSPTTSGAHR